MDAGSEKACEHLVVKSMGFGIRTYRMAFSFAIDVILLLRLYELISMCIIFGIIIHHAEEQAYIFSVNTG